MVARTRTISGACAAANEAARSVAKVLAPISIRDNFGMKSSQRRGSSAGVTRSNLTPRPLRYSGTLAGGSAEIGLDQSPQFGRYHRGFPEPQCKTAHRLVQQHAKPVGRAQPARCGAAD